MNVRLVLLAGAAVALTGCTTLVSNEAFEMELTEASAGTRILVTVPQPTGSRGLSLAGGQRDNYQLRGGYRPAPSVEITLDRLAREYDLRRIRGWPVRSVGVYCEEFEIEAGRDVDSVLERLSRDTRIDVAQRLNVFETLTSRYNDPLAELQTSVSTLSMEIAHDIATGRGITVAVVDSQVDTRHPELKSRVRYTRDLVDNGFSFHPEVHGTAVAGVIASAANNTEGIVGVAPDAQIAALRACWAGDSVSGGARCSTFSLAQALEAAIELDVQVINLSLSGPEDPLLGQLITEAIRRGRIVVAALAPDADGDNGFPASHPGVIAATTHVDSSIAPRRLVVQAPGSEILTTTPEAGYAFLSGNSLAAAHVSGVAALLLERIPGLDGEAIFALLNASADRPGTDGSINACRALSRLVSREDCDDQPAAEASGVPAVSAARARN